jgi:catechol 2,3-dioxygenase-like lactoylglutathione lyase family enzyme
MLSSHPIVAFAATEDPVRAKAFYQDALGLRLLSEDPFALVFDACGTMLRVTPVKKVAVAGYTVLGWHVPDIVETATGLKKAGVVFQRYPGLQQDELGVWSAPGGTKVAWFKDPDGNTLSLSQS